MAVGFTALKTRRRCGKPLAHYKGHTLTYIYIYMYVSVYYQHGKTYTQTTDLHIVHK